MNTPPASPQAMTLAQLTTMVGNTLRTRPELQSAWVTAELSDVRSSGGHCYMELVEKNEAGSTVAKLRANIWSSTFARLHRKFHDATGRTIASGIKVMVRGSVSHHNIYGLSFNITDIDPSYTLGDMERLRREILDTLVREGIAEANRNLPMPLNPQRVAVISAAGAAGYGDFCNQLETNPAGFVFYPHLFGAVMQGENTAPSIMAALEYIEMTIDLWDCVVIIRGGGSSSDLGGFDTLDLARAVARCPLPVIVGIGHERDFTVLDYVAHTRCKTPTAVAEFLIDALRNAAQQASSLVNAITRYASERVRGEQQRLSAAASMIPAIGAARLREASLHLQTLGTTLPATASARVASARRDLSAKGSLLSAFATSRVQEQLRLLDSRAARLSQECASRLSREQERLSHLRGMLDVLSPAATLRRGYTITRVDGKAVTSTAALTSGSEITTTFADGTAVSTIKETTNTPQP